MTLGVGSCPNRSALANVTQLLLDGTLATYGIVCIGPKLSGGCEYVIVTPFWT